MASALTSSPVGTVHTRIGDGGAKRHTAAVPDWMRSTRTHAAFRPTTAVQVCAAEPARAGAAGRAIGASAVSPTSASPATTPRPPDPTSQGYAGAAPECPRPGGRVTHRPARRMVVPEGRSDEEGRAMSEQSVVEAEITLDED